MNGRRFVIIALVLMLVAPGWYVRPRASGDVAPQGPAGVAAVWSGEPGNAPQPALAQPSHRVERSQSQRRDRNRRDKDAQRPSDGPDRDEARQRNHAEAKREAGRNDAGQERARKKPRREGDERATQSSQKDRKAAKRRRQRERRQERKCEQAGNIWLPRVKLCTHGPDPAPPGVDVTRRARPLPAARSRVAAEAVVCDGDGQSGPRVQVLYVRAADVPNHYGRYLDSFRAWAANVDSIVKESAAEAGGGRRVRFVMTPGCGAIDVEEVVVSPSGDDTFQGSIAQLRARGYDRTDRKYLMFVDTTSAGICGIGNVALDDRPEQANRNNTGPMYARVDAGCWDQSRTPTHELFHTLGAVQGSAPNTSGALHCIDEYDVMCYEDAPTTPPMRFDCPDPADDDRLDCGKNDYFHPDPHAGSYLATHWNTADNKFLIVSEAAPADTEPPIMTWVAPVGNGETHEVSDGTIDLEVLAEDNVAINHVQFKGFDFVRGDWFHIAVDTASPYTASLAVADLQPGDTYVLATAYDTAANKTEENIYVWKEGTDPPDPTVEPTPDFLTVAIASPANGAQITTGTTVDIEVDVSNGNEMTTIEVRACPGSSCSWPNGTSLGADGTAPYAVSWQPPSTGTFTLLARADDPDRTLSDPITVSVDPAPTHTPTPEPTFTPTPEPTFTPTLEPTATSTPLPTATSTPQPTNTPTPKPTSTPTPQPTNTPRPDPTATPTPEPDPDPLAVAITSPRRGAKLKAKKRVTIAVDVSGADVDWVEIRVCAGANCDWADARPVAVDESAPYSARWKTPKKGTVTFFARAGDDGDAASAEPVTVKIKKAKKKKKKRR